jgi:hypothetical protein
MTDLLATMTVAEGGANRFEFAYAAHVGKADDWCVSPVVQSSQAAPALGTLNGDLWTAFRGNSDTKIYTASLTDWGANGYTGQDSSAAPALAEHAGKLWLAFVGPSGHIEIISSTDGSSWPASDKIDTGRASVLSPALASFGGALWLAFTGSDGAIKVASSADWAQSYKTGRSGKIGPALAAFDGKLWVGFVGETHEHIETISSQDGATWQSSDTLDTGQSSSVAPALGVFDGKLWAAYADRAGKVQLLTLLKGADWSAPTDTGRRSTRSPALASIAAAAFQGPLGGFNQYVFFTKHGQGEPPVGVNDLVVAFKVTEDIKVSQLSGLPANSQPQPISIQINGYSQHGDKTDCWQQYGFQINPGANQLSSWAENWPIGVLKNPNILNLFNLSSTSTVALPDDLTIPAGWTITIAFQHLGDAIIKGFTCKVTDASGAQVGPNLDISLHGKPLAAGGTIADKDMARIVAFQVMIVGWANSVDATLTGGAGEITCSSSTVMHIDDSWPTDADGSGGTAEDSNAVYSLVPAQKSKVIAQNFGVDTAPNQVGVNQTGLMMLIVDDQNDILAGVSTDGAHWWHSYKQTPGFVKTGHSSQASPSLVAIGGTGGSATFGAFYMAMVGKDDNGLYWRGSADGVIWDQQGDIGASGWFAPSLMMYYNADNSGLGPWLGFVGNTSNDLFVDSALSWNNTWAGPTFIGQTSQSAPALTGMIDYYVMLFLSDDPSNRLLACQTQPNSQGQWVWQGANDTGLTSSAAPSLAGFNNNMLMAYLANDSSRQIWLASSPDGMNWSGATPTGHFSLTAPCLRNVNGLLFLAFVGVDDGEARVASSIDGINWTQSASTGVKTSFAPALAGFDFELTFSLS